jgi:hypothetical protein
MSIAFNKRKKARRKMVDDMYPPRRLARRMLKAEKTAPYELLPVAGSKLFKSGIYKVTNKETKKTSLMKVRWPKILSVYQRAMIIYVEGINEIQKRND